MKNSGTILLIEDEPLLIDISYVLLKKLNYKILIAKTGQAAINIAKKYKEEIELVLLDIGLPDMAGKEVYEKLKQARPSVKVIICSGYSAKGPGREILEAGANAFLQKPFSFSELSEKIEMLIERRKEIRYKAIKEAVVIPDRGSSIECKIIDISRSGMAFCYDKPKNFSKAITELTIHAVDGDFSFVDIPCTSISNIQNADDSCDDPTHSIRHSISFGNLTSSQMEQIEHFIQNHSMTESA